jgi:hypothetical protein
MRTLNPNTFPAFKEERPYSFSKFFKLKEMMGSVASIVSCDDLKNPDFQIQGSLSNLKCKKRKKNEIR